MFFQAHGLVFIVMMSNSLRENVVGSCTRSSSATDVDGKEDTTGAPHVNESNATTTGGTRTIRGYRKDLRYLHI